MQNIIPMEIDFKKELYRFEKAQQEDDVVLDINLFENGTPKDLTGATIELIYVNANNTIANVTGSSIVISANNVKITCPRDCTRSHGIAKFQLKIINSNKQVSTFPIGLVVAPGANQGQEVSQNISTILEELTAMNITANETIESLNAWVASHEDIVDIDKRVGAVESKLVDKVDKVAGKVLSTNDYTALEKAEVAKVKDKVDKIVGKGLSTNDYDNVAKAEVAKIKDKTDKTYVDNELTSKAIVESGSNSNGNYIKYGDGTMICYNNKVYGTAMTTPSGSLYTTGTLNWTFPQTFVGSIPTCFVIPKGSTIKLFAQLMDTYKYDSVDFSLTGTTSANLGSIAIGFFAIGRWK